VIASRSAALAPGDVVTVTRIDRLARSSFDLFGIVKRIVGAKGQFRLLAEPWADTGTSTGYDRQCDKIDNATRSNRRS
jgi:DNA invertase Pin-like site-specific DNA recombinase